MYENLYNMVSVELAGGTYILVYNIYIYIYIYMLHKDVHYDSPLLYVIKSESIMLIG